MSDFGWHFDLDSGTQLKAEGFGGGKFFFNVLKVVCQNLKKFWVLKVKKVKENQKKEFKNKIRISRWETVITTSGFRININPSDYGISKELVLFKEKEPLLTQKFQEQLITNKDDVVLEVGANIGYFALLQKHAKKVFCVEPVSSNFELLQNNIVLNKCDNFSCFKLAFGSENKKGKIYLNDEASNWASMLGNGEYERINILTVDSFVEANSCPSLIRMDVEGFELEVLKGAEKTLKNKKLKKLLIGIHFQYLGKEKFRELLHLIKNNGFKISFAVDEKSIVDIESSFFKWIMKNLNQEHLLKHELINPSYLELQEWIEKRHQCPNVLFTRVIK